MHEALSLIRRELGPDAAVLHTREVRVRRMFGWMRGPRQIEVTASAEVNVPSRLRSRRRAGVSAAGVLDAPSQQQTAVPDNVQSQLTDLQGMV